MEAKMWVAQSFTKFDRIESVFIEANNNKYLRDNFALIMIGNQSGEFIKHEESSMLGEIGHDSKDSS